MSRPDHILLVDDQQEMELIVRYLSRRSGREVVARYDVPSAWDYLSAATALPELILLDINFPGPSGLELCHRLRQSDVVSLARLPVAVFSHWSRTEEIEAALEVGADMVLAKDLVAQPDQWHQRLGEIFSDLNCQSSQNYLSYQKPSFTECLEQEPTRYAERLARALSALPVSPPRRETLRLLVRRFVARTGLAIPDFEGAADFLGLGRDGTSGLLPNADRLESVSKCVGGLAEQLRYVFGIAAVEPFLRALDQGQP